MPTVILTAVALIVAYLTPCAAWHASTAVTVARPAIRKHIIATMVDWDRTPPELEWAKAAWDTMGLNAHDIDQGDECIVVPDQLVPDHSRSVRWMRADPRRRMLKTLDPAVADNLVCCVLCCANSGSFARRQQPSRTMACTATIYRCRPVGATYTSARCQGARDRSQAMTRTKR